MDPGTNVGMVKSYVRAVLLRKGQIPFGRFLIFYSQLAGRPLPFKECGYETPISFLQSMDDIVEVHRDTRVVSLLPPRVMPFQRLDNPPPSETDSSDQVHEWTFDFEKMVDDLIATAPSPSISPPETLADGLGAVQAELEHSTPEGEHGISWYRQTFPSLMAMPPINPSPDMLMHDVPSQNDGPSVYTPADFIPWSSWDSPARKSPDARRKVVARKGPAGIEAIEKYLMKPSLPYQAPKSAEERRENLPERSAVSPPRRAEPKDLKYRLFNINVRDNPPRVLVVLIDGGRPLISLRGLFRATRITPMLADYRYARAGLDHIEIHINWDTHPEMCHLLIMCDQVDPCVPDHVLIPLAEAARVCREIDYVQNFDPLFGSMLKKFTRE